MGQLRGTTPSLQYVPGTHATHALLTLDHHHPSVQLLFGPGGGTPHAAVTGACAGSSGGQVRHTLVPVAAVKYAAAAQPAQVVAAYVDTNVPGAHRVQVEAPVVAGA